MTDQPSSSDGLKNAPASAGDVSSSNPHHRNVLRQKQQQEESTIDTIAGVMGNVLEWYDFALFGFFSDIIAQVFLKPEDPNNPQQVNDNLIKSFVIFGSAFLMRPVGGLVIGYIGDKHGRKTALTRSLFMMAVPTTLMGCLPTYQQVGIFSTILLCLCRLVQGISVGGQLPASLVYTVEKRPKEHWGYYGAFPMVAANVGTLLGNLCGALMRQVLTEDQLLTWGWRLPFFSGIIIAFVACYLRRRGPDVHTNQGIYDRQDSEIKNPIRVAVRRENRCALLSTSLTPMLWAAGFYVSFVWMAIFMGELLEPPIPGAFWINSVALAVGMTWVLPVAGAISDRCGRIRIMTLSGLLLTGLGPIILIMIAKGNAIVAFFAQLVLGILLSFYGGPLCAWIVENFSPEVRMTSASMGYDISHAVAGGFSPAMATALYTNVGTYAAGLIYVLFGIVSILGIYVTYCCGGSQKEADTGDGAVVNGTYPTIVNGTSSLEMKESPKSANGENGEDSETFRSIV